MTEAAMSEEALKLGLLMEAAQAQQRLSQESLERLEAHTRDLDAIVREEIRQTVAEALEGLAAETRCAADALKRLRRVASLRALLWAVSVTVVCAGVGWAEACWLLPSRRQIAALGAERDALAASVSRLERRGALIDLRRCGARARLCVRVDRDAPAYGAGSDYLIVKGY